MYHDMVHATNRNCFLIVNFRDKWLEDYFEADKPSKKIPADLDSRLFRKLQLIDDASSDKDLRSPPSNHFEKLKGNLDGFSSIRVNNQWRIIFQWNNRTGEAFELYLDNHSYR